MLKTWAGTISIAAGLASAIPKDAVLKESGAKGMRSILDIARKAFTGRPQPAPAQPSLGQYQQMSKGKMYASGVLCSILALGLVSE